MEWKMFGIKGKLVSAKHKMFKVVRSIGGLGKEEYNVSSPTPVSAVAPYEPVDSLTNYSLEAELKKAQALMYLRRMERPK